MANIDGLPVNSAVTHAEFMSRTEDTSTTGSVNFQNVTESTSTTTGAIKTAGGLGVEKSLNVGINAFVGGELIVIGETTLNSTLNATDIIAANITADQLDTPIGNIDTVTSGSVSATTINATTVNTDDLNLTNALTVPSITVTTDAVINGNLTVNGTTTTLNTATVDSEDPNITLNKNGNNLSSEGSGLTVDRTGTKGSLQYANALASKFKIGDLASEAEVVTVSHTQTLTNKTISGSANTITNVSLSAGVTGTLPITSGGTGQTTQTAAFDALSPLTTKGDIIVNDGTNDIRLAVGTNAHVLTADSTQPSGVKWAAASGAVATPTVQKFTSGSGTYTKPANVTYIRVTMVGGGGSPTVSGVGAGNAGAASTFGTSLLSAGGGAGSTTSFGASGGASSLGTGPIGIALPGGGGGSGGITNTGSGGQGGSSAFGGAGIGGYTGISTGTSGGANTGGGGGGNANAGGPGSGGGGAGGYVCALIISPSATYSYAVGAGGAALSGGSAGGSGLILVEEYY